jgi:hypothetical protein
MTRSGPAQQYIAPPPYFPQIANEQLDATARKVEAEADAVSRQVHRGLRIAARAQGLGGAVRVRGRKRAKTRHPPRGATPQPATIQSARGENFGAQVAGFVERQERVSEEVNKLAASLGETEERLRRAGTEGRALSQEAASVDRAAQRAAIEARAVEAESLRALSGATTAEKSSAKSVADIQGESWLPVSVLRLFWFGGVRLALKPSLGVYVRPVMC